MKKTKAQKGITLIALIITIIVLLILAVVAIGAVQNDGIIEYAKNARSEYERAQLNERTGLENYLSGLDENNPNGDSVDVAPVPNHSGTIPDGGIYYVGVTSTKTGNYTGATATYNAGESFPEVVSTGDVYIYGDYEYRYNYYYATYSRWEKDTDENTWGVSVLDKTKSSYDSEILGIINGGEIKELYATFVACTSLVDASNIVIPNTVQKMGSTFRGCTALTTLPTVPNSVTEMSSTFYNCTALTTIPEGYIPTSVTKMGSTFYGCTALKDLSNLVIPSSVTAMDSTFWGCTSLTNPPSVIPDSVTSMASTFRQCDTLTKAPKISNNVTSMSHTFDSCKALTDVSNLIIPSSVTDMDYTFNNCTALTNMPDISKVTGVTDLNRTFKNCTALTDLSDFVIPSSITSLQNTFEFCSALTTAPKIPSNIKSMDYTFKDCTSLTGTIEINTSSAVVTGCFMLSSAGKDITLAGSSTILQLFANTSSTGMRTVYDINGNILKQ